MRGAKDTLFRQWTLLQHVPRSPGSIGTAALAARLEESGYRVDVRTIQRDLVKLSTVFPLSAREEGRASRWFWSRDARIMDLPGMDMPTALAFRLAKEYLTPLLPKTILQHLNRHFRRAEELLTSQRTNRLGLWPEKVCAITRGPALLQPVIQAGVQAAVEQALLDDRQLQVVYRSKDANDAKRYVVHPCGLVLRDGMMYLIATLKDYTDLRHLALHRMTAAQMLDRPVRRPKGFGLRRYVREEQFFGYPLQGAVVQFDVLLESKAAVHLSERPLSRNQTLTMWQDGRTRLQATVKDTLELRWWLLGFGDKVEVLGPKALREEFAVITQRAAAQYRET
jgi:predicted DNA-binding transcriptional regulator YafY